MTVGEEGKITLPSERISTGKSGTRGGLSGINRAAIWRRKGVVSLTRRVRAESRAGTLSYRRIVSSARVNGRAKARSRNLRGKLPQERNGSHDGEEEKKGNGRCAAEGGVCVNTVFSFCQFRRGRSKKISPHNLGTSWQEFTKEEERIELTYHDDFDF